MSGNTKKDSKYLKTITEAIAEFEDHPKHSKNAGINMQAHHLISEQGLKAAKDLERIDHLGYDINELENLVFIPTDPIDACHMNVQVHRSGHTSRVNSSDDIDDEHPLSYHEFVTKLVNMNTEKLDELCKTKLPYNQKKNAVQNSYNRISRKIIGRLNNFTLKLTSSADNFHPDSPIGCSNFNNIKKDRPLKNCNKKRLHNKKLPTKYRLEQGR